ncbi:ribosomal L27 protein-domain-containing protein [Bisporella sp. PMI_857]|nr:ribosomal L27 protein-domain-containing protein [Bisporella sp. PMI_857]
MVLARLQPPLRAAITSIGKPGASQTFLSDAFAYLSIRGPPTLTFVRHASHAQQGAVNKAKDGPGKRLGAKKSGEQYVIPGNIIFRQRGTLWFPGDNCAMGRDHTIYATEAGYVKYYKDPKRNPKRQYIGVTFERDQVLPLPPNSPRRRRLGMLAEKMETPAVEESEAVVDDLGVDASGLVQKKKKGIKERKGEEGRVLTLRPGYMYRESNWQIGRAAERANIRVKPFVPGDRWAAWKKATMRKAKNAERKGLGRSVKSKK